jgi:NADH dehydrogenase [ubiquinone] 1 alpha subcomplex assembly factor 6
MNVAKIIQNQGSVFSRHGSKVRHLHGATPAPTKASKKDFDYCVDLVQSRDRESYLCGLLMPHEARRAFFSIRAFNVELASVKDGSISRQIGGAQFDESGASMALKVKIQWWRSALGQIYGDNPADDQPMDSFAASMARSTWNNPIIRALDYSVQDSQLTCRFLERLIEAREQDLDIKQPETMDDVMNYAENISSSLLYLSLETTNVSSN